MLSSSGLVSPKSGKSVSDKDSPESDVSAVFSSPKSGSSKSSAAVSETFSSDDFSSPFFDAITAAAARPPRAAPATTPAATEEPSVPSFSESASGIISSESETGTGPSSPSLTS